MLLGVEDNRTRCVQWPLFGDRSGSIYDCFWPVSGRDLKLDPSVRLLLKNQRARGHDLAMADVAYPQGHEVARSKLAINRQIEHREISTTVGDLKPDARIAHIS